MRFKYRIDTGAAAQDDRQRRHLKNTEKQDEVNPEEPVDRGDLDDLIFRYETPKRHSER